MVPGLSPESGSESAAERRNFQYELEGPRQSGRTWEEPCCGIQIAHHERADQLLDVSPLTDVMSDQANHKQFPVLQPAQSQNADHGLDHEPEDLTLREHKLDLAALREKLREKTGKQYWRTLEEL